MFNAQQHAHEYYLKNKSRWINGYHGNSTKLESHHVKYKEIHGVDEIIWLTSSQHKQIHIELAKKEGYIKPSKEIIIKAKNRASSNKPYRLKYRASSKCRENRLKNNHDHVFSLQFTEDMGSKIRLMETIVYNTNKQDFTFSSCFYSTKIKVKRINDPTIIKSNVMDYI